MPANGRPRQQPVSVGPGQFAEVAKAKSLDYKLLPSRGRIPYPGSRPFLLGGVAGNRMHDERVIGVPKPFGCHSEGVSEAVSLQTVREFMKGE